MTQTDRLGLPLLAAAQAQKEITHNEALVSLDSLLQAVVVSVAPSSVPGAPVAGQSWIVGDGAAGDWIGQDGALATWTSGGWRFAAAFDGMTVWSLADSVPARRDAGLWEIGQIDARALRVAGNRIVGERGDPIANPSGGTTIDTEARTCVTHILDALRTHGLIET